MFKKNYLIISLLLMIRLLIAQDHQQQLDKALEGLYHKYDLPGFSTMIVTKDRTLNQLTRLSTLSEWIWLF